MRGPERIGLVMGLMLTALLAFQAQAAELGKLRVGIMPIVDCLQIFVADAKGYFKDEGLTVEMPRMAGGAVIAPAVEGGTLEMGWSNVVSIALAHEQGFDYVFVTPGATEAPGFRPHKIMVGADSPVRAPKDLEGKTVAVNTLANIPYVAAATWLKGAGVALDKVKFVEVPFPNMEAALKTKRVDAAVMLEPFVTVSQAAGSARILEVEPFKVFGPRALIASWFAKKSWVEKNPQQAKAFARAIGRANQFIRANQPEARQILLSYTRLSKDLAEKIALPAFEETLSEADLQAVVDATARLGLLKKPFPAKEIILLQ
jgi:NitT/TauT family transport system substrate-binding protein